MLRRARAGSRPSPDVELACGSRSTSRVGWPASASAAARLIAVVVLPTPPFWFTTATMGGAVVANILGFRSDAAPISGAIGANSIPEFSRWLAGLLRARGHGDAAPPGTVDGKAEEYEAPGGGEGEESTSDAD